jgi:hypothetical protein
MMEDKSSQSQAILLDCSTTRFHLEAFGTEALTCPLDVYYLSLSNSDLQGMLVVE